MNGVIEYFEIKLKQTSKGIWYCDGIVASTKNMDDSITQADNAMTKIEEILDTHNKKESEEK